MNQKGFTLIETLIYIALFTIIIGGGMSAAYGIIESSDRTSTRTVVEQEGIFLTRKINWALSGANDAIVSGTQLTIDPATGPDLVFTLNGTDIELDGTKLNSANVKVTNLAFVRIPSSGSNPRIRASFTLTGTKGNSQTFETIKYIR